MTELKKYLDEYQDKVVEEIIEFWKVHNSISTVDDALEGIKKWTDKDHLLLIVFHRLYFKGYKS
ncbi:hypothetical protein [Anaerosalibacter massiliensis]|uniref:Uncharacterized protein n=1 Tax=Anaerosalibacter massiliensis TaxID=1347392 RepID=A0A9X2MI06_9FIRM|nr:hypothetical protein [Anaerosalibacter massiliensis]MCR2044049.1 hypothetical protein [Anaerosalibacter massiliensis]